jgi:hypothetical protein
MELAADLLVLVHVLLIVLWLGIDVVVFGLSMSLLNRGTPIALRIDRAEIAQRIDAWVLKSFLLTMPLGAAIAWLKGYDIFATPFLALKIAVMALIFILAVFMLTGASATTAQLRRIASDPPDREAIEADLRWRIIAMAYPVQGVYALVILNVFIALTPGRW